MQTMTESKQKTERKVLVNAESLARLLQDVDPGGFMSNELGVAWVDDGSGYARKLIRHPILES